MAKLFEGLKEGDLEDLVLPMVSIDEFESKLDDDSIVVAFYVQDSDPATDLNRFIQKGAVSLLDTDVSPAPNEDGYFMVFVELLRDPSFPQKLMDILSSVEGLTAITSWTGQIYDVEGAQPIGIELLTNRVRLVSREDHDTTDSDSQEVKEFFGASDLEGMVVEGRSVVLEARGVAVQLELVDLGTVDAVMERNAAMAQATQLNESALANAARLQRMLGDQWLVEQRGDKHIVVAHALSETCALFNF